MEKVILFKTETKERTFSPKSADQNVDDEDLDGSMIQVRPIFSSLDKEREITTNFRKLMLGNRK